MPTVEQSFQSILAPDIPTIPDDVFTPPRHDEGLTADELNERVDQVVVPIPAGEWASRYQEAVEELRELRRRSPFSQQFFSAIRKADSITYIDLNNYLDF